MVVLLVTGGYDNTVKLWDPSSGISYKQFTHSEKQINNIVISPDKQYIATAGNPTIRLYDINSKGADPLYTFEGHTQNVTSIGFHRDGQWLYSASEDNSIKIWDLRTSISQRDYHARAPIASVILHPNQGEIISGDMSGVLRIWDLQSNQCTTELQPEADTPISAVSMTNDANCLIATNYNGNIYAWTPNTNRNSNNNSSNIRGSINGNINSGSSDGNTAFSLDTSTSHQNTLLSSSSSSELYIPLTKISAHRAYILSAKISPDGKYIATTSSDRTLKLWNIATPATMNTTNTGSSASSPFPTTTTTTPLPWTCTSCFLGHTRWVWDCSWSADSSYVISASTDGTARLWEVATGETVRTYSGHHKGITSVALNDAAPIVVNTHTNSGSSSSNALSSIGTTNKGGNNSNNSGNNNATSNNVSTGGNNSNTNGPNNNNNNNNPLSNEK